MDQSGPRREPGDASRRLEQRPLIIERPDLAHPVRRALAFCLTLLAWAGWLALWLPVLGALVAPIGMHLPGIALPGQISLAALRELLGVFPFAIVLVLAVLAVNGLGNRIYRRFSTPTVHRLVGTQYLATQLALDADKLAAWQAARIVHVEHGAQGRVVDARIAE